VLCTDVVRERARAMADEVRGEAVDSNAELAERADVVVLAHKPPQLHAVADELGGRAKAVVSILGGVPLAELRAAYPDVPVVRTLPSTPVEVRQGVVLRAAESDAIDGLDPLLDELGRLVVLPEALVDPAMVLMSNAPAFWALLVEAQVDAGVLHGLTPHQATELVLQTMTGTAAVLERQGGDTLAARRAVTSPGGSTARGLEALERAGVRTAFQDAMRAVLQR
jgi:pyrroline-5-carboxylate reductase